MKHIASNAIDEDISRNFLKFTSAPNAGFQAEIQYANFYFVSQNLIVFPFNIWLLFIVGYGHGPQKQQVGKYLVER